MKVLRDIDVPQSPDLRTYREFVLDHLVAGLAMAGVAVGAVAAPLANAAWRTPAIVGVCLFSAAGVGLMARFALNAFRASRRPESWLVRWTPQGLYLRFRSFHNYRFPADTPSVVFVARREIAWLRAHAQALEVPDERGPGGARATLRRTVRSVELGLDGADTAGLAAALGAEAARRDARGMRVNDYPVTVTGAGTVRVEMRRPEALLAQLAPYYPVRGAEAVAAKPFDAMTRREQEDHILALVQAGEKLAAITAARAVYGCDLAEAKRLVEELAQR